MKKIKTYPTTFVPISEGGLRSKGSSKHQPSVGVPNLTKNRQKCLEKIALESKAGRGFKEI